MEWFLGFLLIVSIAFDIVLYILYRGGFIRFSQRSETLAETQKNLAGNVKNLSKRVDDLTETQNSFGEFSQRIQVLEDRVGKLDESHAELDGEVSKLFNERTLPMIVAPEREPAKPNRGGRPRKVG